MIPPESELSEHYQVSSITVRQALEILEYNGLIMRQRGRGTFVAKPTLNQNLTRIVSFTEDMRQRGWQAGTCVLSATLVSDAQEVAEKLNVPKNEPLAYVERLRLANGEPVSVEESFIVNRYCPAILEYDFVKDSMRSVLEQIFKIRLTGARQTIRALKANQRLAHLLMVKNGSPILHIERVSYSEHNIPIEFLRISYRGDRYSLHNELQG